MRLSEKRIRHLAREMAQEMLLRKAVNPDTPESKIAPLIAQAISQDQAMEEKIEGEARQILSRNPRIPPPGTGEYAAAFQETKRQVAARKGFKL